MIPTNVCLSPDFISEHVNRDEAVYCLLQKIYSQLLKKLSFNR